MEKIVLVLPFWWADYLMDNDDRELSEDDRRAIDQFIAIMDDNYGLTDLKEVSGYQFWTSSHNARMFRVPACMCSHFTFVTVKE